MCCYCCFCFGLRLELIDKWQKNVASRFVLCCAEATTTNNKYQRQRRQSNRHCKSKRAQQNISINYNKNSYRTQLIANVEIEKKASNGFIDRKQQQQHQSLEQKQQHGIMSSLLLATVSRVTVLSNSTEIHKKIYLIKI